jgi:hypothetical protein
VQRSLDAAAGETAGKLSDAVRRTGAGLVETSRHLYRLQ